MQRITSYSWRFIVSWLSAMIVGGSLGASLSLALKIDWLRGLVLGMVVGNLLAVGMYFWRMRPPLITHLPEVNIRLLGWVLMLTAASALLYLLMGSIGTRVNTFFPWDGVVLLVACALAELLRRRGQSFWAASILMSTVFPPIAFNAQFYGMSSPVNAAYLIGLLIGGLVLGSSGFFGALAAMCTLTALFAIGEQMGRWTPVYPVGTPTQSVVLVLFWWSLYGAGAWLSALFARSLERALQASHGQTQALVRTFNALTPDATLDHLLTQTLTTLAEQLDASLVQLFLHDPTTATLTIRLTHPAAPSADMWPPIPTPALPIWSALITTCQPIVIDDLANDPRLLQRAALMAAGARAVLYVPLLANGSVTGMFGLSRATRWTADEIELAQALAQHATLAMRLTALSAQTQQAAIWQERNRMAREIHDTLAQGLTGILIQLEAADDVADESAAELRQHLTRARALARDSLAEARRSVYALRPHSLEHKPLPQALRDSLIALTSATPTRLHFSTPEHWPVLSPELEIDLLRLTQEAVTNTLKHAHANTVDVALQITPTQIELRIHDDGAGFDLALASAGFGLIAMRDRAAKHGGTLILTSRPNTGTTIACAFPYSDSA